MTAPRELFDAYLDGELSADEMQRLDAWIAADAANASLFLNWMALQAWTYEALRNESLEQVMAEPANSTKIASTPFDSRNTPAARQNALPHARPTTPAKNAWPMAMAATLLLAAWGIWIVMTGHRGARDGQQLAQRPSMPTVEQTAEDAALAATLTRLEDCVWREESAALRYGEELFEGSRIALQSGMARITFESGAQALLEGPCDFTVDNAMRGTIRSGRLSVTVPPRAVGFRIRSPNAEVIDLGTEFGVDVQDGQHSEVHVFKGEVLSRRLNDRGEQHGELFHLAANHAMKFVTADRQPSAMASMTSKFVRHLAEQVPLEVRKRLPVDRDLALWLAADLAVKTEGKRVVAWPDILCGDNLSAEDALQPDERSRPVLAPDAIHGRPAIRFNGWSSYLVTTPLETTDNQTIVLVCQFSPKALRPKRTRGGQILNYNGPPHRLLSNPYEPGVLQIGEPIVDGFAPTRLEGKRFAGKHEGRDISESQILTQPVGADAPVVLAYRYDLNAHSATLWINGELIGEEHALGPAGITSRKVIGRHGFMKYHFQGDLGELLIYNRALSNDQLNDVARYLGHKYQIPIKASTPTL